MTGVPRWSLPPDRRQQRFDAFDGLRFLACLLVVAGHAITRRYWFLPGSARVGVEIFFSLSGFLITYLLLDERKSFRRIDLRNFYFRRGLRILPVYYVALGAGALVTVILHAYPSLAPAFSYTPDSRQLNVGLLSSIFLIRNWFDIPEPANLKILWSVCVEEQFYLFFPVWIAASRARFPVLLPTFIGLILNSASRLILFFTGNAELIYGNTLAHGDELMLGALTAQAYHASPAFRSWLAKNASAGQLVSFAACLLTAGVIYALPTPTTAWGFSWTYFVPAFVTTALVATLAPGNGMLAAVLRVPSISRLGRLTYAAYVFHTYPEVFSWWVTAGIPGDGVERALVRAAVSVSLTFAVAALSYRIIEKRFLDMRSRFSHRGVSEQDARA